MFTTSLSITSIYLFMGWPSKDHKTQDNTDDNAPYFSGTMLDAWMETDRRFRSGPPGGHNITVNNVREEAVPGSVWATATSQGTSTSSPPLSSKQLSAKDDIPLALGRDV